MSDGRRRAALPDQAVESRPGIPSARPRESASAIPPDILLVLSMLPRRPLCLEARYSRGRPMRRATFPSSKCTCTASPRPPAARAPALRALRPARDGNIAGAAPSLPAAPIAPARLYASAARNNKVLRSSMARRASTRTAIAMRGGRSLGCAGGGVPNARRQRGAAAARPRAARAVGVGPGSLRRETSVADLHVSVMPRRRRDEFAAQVAPGTVPPCRAGRIGASAIEPARAPKCAPRDNRCPKHARRGDWKITRPKNMACLERSWGALGHTPGMKASDRRVRLGPQNAFERHFGHLRGHAPLRTRTDIGHFLWHARVAARARLHSISGPPYHDFCAGRKARARSS